MLKKRNTGSSSNNRTDKEAVKETTKATWRNYGICAGIEALIAFLVIWSKGFFAHSLSVNIQILADAFFVSGVLMLLFAGLMYVSGEGALIGIGFVMRNVFLAFLPMGRTRHETYAKYRARKLGSAKKSSNRYALVTGLGFLLIGVVLTVIWFNAFFDASVL